MKNPRGTKLGHLKRRELLKSLLEVILNLDLPISLSLSKHLEDIPLHYVGA